MKLLIILITTIGTNAWNDLALGRLSHDLVTEHNIPCISVVYPRGENNTYPVFRVLKSLLKANPLRQTRATVLHQPGNLYQWRGCSRVLNILLAWLSNAKEEFVEFTNSPITNDPVWLILLSEGTTAKSFIGNAFLPFPARVLVVTIISESSVTLEEAWKIAIGYNTRVVPYAKWSLQEGLNCQSSQCAFHPRKDLEGVPFRASTKEDMPLSELTINPSSNSLYIGGYFGAIYYELASQLNATPVVVPARENATGTATSNGSWVGLIGMMQRSEIDFGVGPISMEHHTSEVIDFLKPLLRTNFQVFFKQDGTVIEWDAYLKPFGKFVWRLIFLWFFVGALALNYFYRICIYYGQENSTYVWEFSKLNSFLTFFKAFCQQGSHLMPHSLSCKGLYLTGYLTSTILVTAYSAALISKITLQEPLRPFDSLETFLEDGSYTLTAILASTDYTYFSEASDTTLKSIYKRMMEFVPSSQLPVGKEEGLIQVCEKSKRALFITFAVTQIAAREISISRKCPILHFSNPLGTAFLTIGLRKQMPYSRLIAIQLQTMAERGILKRLQWKEWPLHSNTGLKISAPEVEIKQVVQIHCLLIIGMVLSVAMLGLERASTSPRVCAALHSVYLQYGINADNTITAFFVAATASIVITIIISFT